MKRFALSRVALLSASLLSISCTAMLGGAGDEEGGESGSSSPFDPDQEIDRSEPFLGPILSAPGQSIRFYRLTHAQYERTIQDLLRQDAPLNLSQLFVAEPLLTTFDTDAKLLSISPDLRRDYERAAETVADTLISDSAILSEAVGSSVVSGQDAEGFVDEFGARAFRRPLTAEEKKRLLTLFSKAPELVEGTSDFLAGVQVVTSYLLQSPHFLYRAELATGAAGAKVALGPYEVASKVSYALTGSMPDDELLASAATGEIATTEGVKKHVARLLETQAGQRIVEDFHYQLLKMREYDAISKNTTNHPEFGEGVAGDLVGEAVQFVHHVVYNLDLGLKELLTAPYTFANERVAQIYGLPAPQADESGFGLLELPSDQRAGLLTQIGFLATYGEGTTPNSILRGVNIAHNILCIDLPPPPDNVPGLADAVGNTNRERIEDLTKDPGCSSCHASFINPLGFAFEGLDGVGKARDMDNGLPVNSSSSYTLDGKQVSYDGPVELMKTVAESPQAHDCYAKHWAEFLYGREMDVKEDEDAALVIQGGWLSQSDVSVKDLITQLIATDSFLTRTP